MPALAKIQICLAAHLLDLDAHQITSKTKEPGSRGTQQSEKSKHSFKLQIKVKVDVLIDTNRLFGQRQRDIFHALSKQILGERLIHDSEVLNKLF